jgi:prefoldin subunit 5
MDWSFSTAKQVELVAEILQLRAEVEALRAEAETLRARIAELEQPPVKKKRGAPTKAEVGVKRGKQLATKGQLPTNVNIGTDKITTSPVVRGPTGKVMTSPWVRKRK